MGKKKNPILKPELERYMLGEKPRLVTYKTGAALYGVEIWKFTEWARSAKATRKWKRWIVVDLNILDEYMQRENLKTPTRRKRNGKA